MGAEGDTWATSGFKSRGGPNVFVQWKGTEVCLDFACSCGYSGHYDGGFAYGLKCAQCGQIWTMPHTFGLIAGGDDGAAVQDTDWPHEDVRAIRRPAELIEDFAKLGGLDDPFETGETLEAPDPLSRLTPEEIDIIADTVRRRREG